MLRRLAGSMMVASLALAGAVQAQANGGLTGSGTATTLIPGWRIQPCPGVQCAVASGNSPNTTTGNGSASTSDQRTLTLNGDGGLPGRPPGFADTKASATLVGPLATPVLKAYGQTFIGYGSPDANGVQYSDVPIDYAASAFAFSAMWYQNSAVVPLSVTIAYNFDAILKTNAPTDLGLMNVSGGISAWTGPTGSGEVILGEAPLGGDGPVLSPFGASITSSSDTKSGLDRGANNEVLGAGSITFTLDAGQGFYLLAFLGVNINGIDGDHLVDAFNTMNVSFEDGQQFLSPEFAGSTLPTTGVPEPGTWVLTAAGVMMLGAARWRRRRFLRTRAARSAR